MKTLMALVALVFICLGLSSCELCGKKSKSNYDREAHLDRYDLERP